MISLAACVSNPYTPSPVYHRVVDAYPGDNDGDYQPPRGYTPKIPVYHEDNDAEYVFPKGRLTQVPQAPMPQDNDAVYTYPKRYKTQNGSHDNDTAYRLPSHLKPVETREDYGSYPRDNEADMLDIYPLYLD